MLTQTGLAEASLRIPEIKSMQTCIVSIEVHADWIQPAQSEPEQRIPTNAVGLPTYTPRKQHYQLVDLASKHDGVRGQTNGHLSVLTDF